MKKNKFKLLLCLSVFALALTSCAPSNPYAEDPRYPIYQLAVDSGFTGTYEEWLESIRGEDGENGQTPHIGENGNWWIGDTDTGVPATGPQGPTGDTGPQGPAGPAGSDGQPGSQGEPGKDGEVGPQGPAGSDGKDGADGVDGKDGTSMHTGHGKPSDDLGKTGDSYVDLDTWDFYVKYENGWVLEGNIKGNDGEPISIETSYIDENGDLIIVLTNGEIINAGHIKDNNLYDVNFYCDDLLVYSTTVKHGDKIECPKVENFDIDGWYIDKELNEEWVFYGYVVTSNMDLYASYSKEDLNISLNNSLENFVDANGNSVLSDELGIQASKSIECKDYLIGLENRGIMFNSLEKINIDMITIDISLDGFENAVLFYGDSPLAFDNSYELKAGINTLKLNEAKYFVIQNTGKQTLNINQINIDYTLTTNINDSSMPTVVINTEDNKNITSRTDYVDCQISTIGAKKDVSDLKAEIKVRGNSTSHTPKKPYRIKLDKKNSLFGYEKAKNWVLLADYMDGSNMHNYTALSFAKMVRDKVDGTFAPNPMHVNVILNGENVGLYLFAEHIEAKEGRLEIEQDNVWEKDFEDINFYIERDKSSISDPEEIEGETYFTIPMENYTLSEYVFALKYPEKDDFEEELDDGTIVTHEKEFFSFFNKLKEYMTEICNRFVSYVNDNSNFDDVAEMVDMQSLALYGVVDQFVRETDHAQKSFKMYRENGGLLKFGPNWDYDSCAYGLPYTGEYIEDPFDSGIKNFNSAYFIETWGYTLFQDMENGRILFNNIWDKLTKEDLDKFIKEQEKEISFISKFAMYDCDKWMNGKKQILFDNLQYHMRFIRFHTDYLLNTVYAY